MTREQIEAFKALAYRAAPGKVRVAPNEMVDAGTAHIAAWSPANVLKFLEAYEAMEDENKALREALEDVCAQSQYLRQGGAYVDDTEQLEAGLEAAVDIAADALARKALGAK